MATLMPSRFAEISQAPLDAGSITAALQPWRKRLSLRHLLRWTVGGIIAGLILACLVLLISRFVPWAGALYWALGSGLACVILALGGALWTRPSIAGSSRIVDARLSLHDRMGTAWELRDQSSVLARLQRHDALEQLAHYTPARAVSLQVPRSTLLLSGLMALLLALLIVLPNPMNDVLRQQAVFQAKIASQVKAIDKIRQELAQQPTTSPAQQKQIDQVLQDLQAKLQQAKNESQAQQAIADAQAKLNQLRNPQSANRAQGHAAASSSLQNSQNSSLSALGQALANNDSKAQAKALQDLASQVSKMTPQQRSDLAQKIEKAANQANQNPDLSSALHQLAKAVANGTPSEISDAASAVQAAAGQDAASQASNTSISQASQSLQDLANSIAASTDGTNSNGQSQNQGQGQGQNPGQGQGQNPGQGQGQGQGPGQSSGQSGQGQGQGQGGQGQGGTGGSNGAGNNQGKTEQVTIPGQIGQGTSTQTNDNNNGIVIPGNSVPYSQVIEQYNQMAHDAIDNSNISPDTKDLVHDYFDTLEGQ